jgi:outer membrane protein
MNKTTAAVGIAALVASFTSQADTLLGLYVGAQGWNMQTSGGFSDDGSNASFNFDDEAQSNIYAALEHPIPFIPNIKLQRTAMDTQGDTQLEFNFTFGDELFTDNSTLTTDVQLTTTDVIFYYELFDNDLISFDLGLNAKYMDGEILVVDQADPSRRGMEEFSGAVPMLYSRIELGLPFTGLGAFAEGSFLNVDDHSLTDYQAAITYQAVDNLAIDVTFQLGYRAVNLELEDLDDIYSDLEFKGAFAGVEIHF